MKESTPEEVRAKLVYEKTRSLANGNAIISGLSGIIGSGVNLIVDIGAIPFYVDLWNEIRRIYGKGEITLNAAQKFLKPNLNFLFLDMVWDKAVGSIPIVGIPFNVAFAKALTWRLGAWFGLLAALAEDNIPDELLTRSTMQLTTELFPSAGTVFTFEAPDEALFVGFISSVDGLTLAEAQDNVEDALKALRQRKNKEKK